MEIGERPAIDTSFLKAGGLSAVLQEAVGGLWGQCLGLRDEVGETSAGPDFCLTGM